MKKIISILAIIGLFGCSVEGNENEPTETTAVTQQGVVVSSFRAAPETESASGVFAWEIRQQDQVTVDGSGLTVVGLDRNGVVAFNQTITTTGDGNEKIVTVEVTVPAAYKYEVRASGDRHVLVPAGDPKITTLISRLEADMKINKTETTPYDACEQAVEYAFNCALASASCPVWPVTVVACPAAGFFCAKYSYCQVSCYYGDASC